MGKRRIKNVLIEIPGANFLTITCQYRKIALSLHHQNWKSMKKCVFLIGLAILVASCSSDDNTGSDDKVVYMLPQTRSISLSADQQQIVSQCNVFDFYSHAVVSTRKTS